jgi:hypothetical protein
VVISREDIVTSLMEPTNADVCRSTLAINVAADPTTSAIVDSIKDAAKAEAASLSHLSSRPWASMQRHSHESKTPFTFHSF